jgi:putative ABC transport system permease protein
VLGLAGGILGVLLGVAVEQVFPVLIERYFQTRPPAGFNPATSLQGLTIGVLTTLLFTLPPLLGIREIKPALIFRRDMAETRASWRERARRSGPVLLAGATVAVGLAIVTGSLIAGTWQEAVRIGTIFLLGLTASLLVLASVSSAVIKGMQVIVQRVRLPATSRHALANLYRPGSQSRSVLTALGVGVMFTLTIHLLQQNMLQEIRRSAPPGMANVFFLDITAEEKDEVARLIAEYSSGGNEPTIISTVSSRLAAIDGVPIDQVSFAERLSRRYRMARAVSTQAELPESAEVIQGSWWKDVKPGRISIEERDARNLNVKPGSTVTWNAFGRTVETQVAAIHRNQGQDITSMVDFYVSPGTLEGLPTAYYGAVRVEPDRVGRLQRAVYAKYPTVTVINFADILERVQEVVDQIAIVVRFISAFAIFAGAVILSSSVAGTRFRRVREMAVFKTLGATRSRMVRMLSTEFLVLGAAAGIAGSALATGFTWVVLERLFEDVPFRVDWLALALSVVATAAIAALSGWLASFAILGQKPLEVLRGE